MNHSTTFDSDEVGALLIDIDGVLTLSWSPIDGAAEALAALRRSGLPLRFATNTTTRTRAEVARRLTELGMSAEPDEILTAPAVTAAHLRTNHPGARCYLLNEGDITADLSGVELVDDPPADVVVIGGAGPAFTYERSIELHFSAECVPTAETHSALLGARLGERSGRVRGGFGEGSGRVRGGFGRVGCPGAPLRQLRRKSLVTGWRRRETGLLGCT